MKLRLLPLAALLVGTSTFATDRVVEEFGILPTYPNITAAVNAAVDGDRIVVKNRAGDIPWIENITISKSLQFVSFANNSLFVVQGTYTIQAAPGRQVAIIGMRNTGGSIAGSGSSTLRSTRVRIVDCELVVGSASFDNDAFDVDVVSTNLQSGNVAINYGNVIGCDITSTATYGNAVDITPAAGTFQGDTCWVVGNKITGPGTSFYDGIFVNSIMQVYHIRNNFVRHGYVGIRFYGGNTASVQNTIWNNTVVAYAGQFSNYGILPANTSSGAIWEIMNNVVTFTGGGDQRGIFKDSGNQAQINVYFNHIVPGMSTAVSPDFTFVSNNTSNQPLTLNADGSLLNAPGAVNGANPSPVFSDIDLSAGDAGAYGGSYTLANYFPLHTGAARVAHVVYPFNVRQGSTLRVKATSFDR
jgi:hypothetical protein